MKYLFFLLLLIPITQVYADTYDDVDLIMDDSTIEINNPLTAYQLTVEPDGFSTRFVVGDELRKYNFDRNPAGASYNIDWLALSSTEIDFDVITGVADSRLVGSGTEFSEVDIDGACTEFTFGGGLNTIDVLAGDLIEILFTGGVACSGGGGGSEEEGGSTGFFSTSPPFESCFNRPDVTLCGLTTNPFGSLMEFFDQLIPGFGALLLWGPIVFGIWYKTQRPEIAAIVGIIIAVTVTGLHPDAINMGLTLAAMSAAIGLVGIFQRVKQTV